MREAIEELIRGLRESAVESRKEADKAFDSGGFRIIGIS